jgi:hypothetical protein
LRHRRAEERLAGVNPCLLRQAELGQPAGFPVEMPVVST